MVYKRHLAIVTKQEVDFCDSRTPFATPLSDHVVEEKRKAHMPRQQLNKAQILHLQLETTVQVLTVENIAYHSKAGIHF